jgi:hypothetical protein
MGFSLRGFVKSLDPTSSSSALGGITRTAIGSIPGGTAILEGVRTAGSVVRSATDRTATTARTTTTAAPVATAAPAASPSLASSWSNLATKPATIAVAAVVVLGLVAALLFRRK